MTNNLERHRKHYTEEEIKYLRNNYRKIKTSQIAEVLGRKEKAIRGKAIELKITIPNKKLIIDKNYLEDLYINKRSSTRKIAGIIGCSPPVVRKNLIKYKIRIRGYSREDSPHWRGGRTKHSSGYIVIKKPDHPRASSIGYVAEHILVWEEAHGKPVPENHSIHHINGIKNDNRAENLVAVPKPQHEKNTLLKITQKRIRNLESRLKELEVRESLK